MARREEEKLALGCGGGPEGTAVSWDSAVM
jgi:hypothetical protein